MTCDECEKLKDELAKVRAENTRKRNELKDLIQKTDLIRQAVDEIMSQELPKE